MLIYPQQPDFLPLQTPSLDDVVKCTLCVSSIASIVLLAAVNDLLMRVTLSGSFTYAVSSYLLHAEIRQLISSKSPHRHYVLSH